MIVDQFTQTKTNSKRSFPNISSGWTQIRPKLFSIPLFWLVGNVPIMGDLVSTKHASEQFVNVT